MQKMMPDTQFGQHWTPGHSQREHDQKDHNPGSSRPRRGVKTHLEECTTRYLRF